MSTKPDPSSRIGSAAHQAAVLAFQLPAPDTSSRQAGGAPEWVQVFPAGPVVATNDGRAFRLSDPAGLVARINAGRMPLLVDYDHRSFFDPAMNGDSVAAGWAVELAARDDGIWARVEWTPKAVAGIRDREWRYISPELHLDPDSGEILMLAAISLVNRPALQMAALARSRSTNPGDTDMKAIAAALGLPDTATEAEILAAIQTGRTELAAAQAAPSPDRFMPRADYDAVLARANTAETELAAQRKGARDAEVETVLAAAVAEGKIAPASKAHYAALAATDAGFEQIKQLCASLPKVIADPNVTTDPAKPGGALSDVERHVAASLGVTEENYVKARGTAA